MPNRRNSKFQPRKTNILTTEQVRALNQARAAAARIAAGTRPGKTLALARDIEQAMRVLRGLQVSSRASADLEHKVIRAPTPPTGNGADGRQ